jgi:hypothetical protein
MKVIAKFLVGLTVATMIAGCASDSVYVPKLPPEAQAKLLDYYKQPDNKVFIIAIDPGGDYAYAYDYGKRTLKEAAAVAVKKCDASREASGVVARPYIYALNNKVVYEEMIRAAQKGPVEDEREAQKEAAQPIVKEVEVDTGAPVAEEM